MKNLFYLFSLCSMGVFFTGCDNDDDDHNDDDHSHVVAPETYSFDRDGMSTVSFGGQTCRVQMAADIYSALNDPSFTAAQIMQMFDDGTGFTTAYTCGKNVGSKTAASSTASATLKGQFDDMVVHLVDNVYPNWTNSASNGVAGQITTSSGSTYQVDAKGLEVDQAFIKGLIGALCVDQITNNYLTASKLDSGSNDATSLGGGEYTDMEHYWDEGYGYLYGYNNLHVGGSDDNSIGISEGHGVLLNKYLKKVNENNEPGIANDIYDAFKLGRAAIVAEDYTLRDEQAAIIKQKLDMIVVYKAIDYLSGGAETIASGASREDTFHGLSEGYGFVLSLQFTNFFTNSEVNAMLDQMMEGEGFWDITVEELNSMVTQIESAAGISVGS